MVVVTQKHLTEAAQAFKDAAKELAAWLTLVESVCWGNLVELQATFPDADYVDGYVVFNIRRNRYRLITVIHLQGTWPIVKHKGTLLARC